MYPFLRPILFRLEPETAHHLTLQLLRVGGLPPFNAILHALYAVPDKPVQAFGLKFKNPVGLAAGYDKDGIAIRGLAALGFGHIEIGTVTPRPQPGNPKPRVFRLIEDEAVINRMGFPGCGSEYVQMQLNRALRTTFAERVLGIKMPGVPKLRRSSSAILGVNLGKNKDTPNEQAVLDYLELLQNFAPYADYLTINISSPNTVGLRQLQGRAALESLLTQLHAQRKLEEAKLEKRVPLLVKLAPDLSEAELEDAIEVILRTDLDGIIATNTSLARDGVRSTLRAESGGLSGRSLTGRADAVLAQVVKKVGGRIPVVGVGGIMNPEDAKRKLDLGATLVQIYTGLIYRGPGLIKEIVTKI